MKYWHKCNPYMLLLTFRWHFMFSLHLPLNCVLCYCFPWKYIQNVLKLPFQTQKSANLCKSIKTAQKPYFWSRINHLNWLNPAYSFKHLEMSSVNRPDNTLSKRTISLLSLYLIRLRKRRVSDQTAVVLKTNCILTRTWTLAQQKNMNKTGCRPYRFWARVKFVKPPTDAEHFHSHFQQSSHPIWP